MNLIGTAMFIRKDFAFYDSCIQAVLEPRLILVYEIIRRFIWRGYAKGKLGEMQSEGFIVAPIGLWKIAKMAGYSHKQRIPPILNRLERLGWLRRTSGDPRRGGGIPCNIYILGERVLDSQGGTHEVLYADSAIQDLLDRMSRDYKTEFGRKMKILPDSFDLDYEEGVDPAKYTKLSEVDLDWKMEKMRIYLEELLGPFDPGHADSNSQEGLDECALHGEEGFEGTPQRTMEGYSEADLEIENSLNRKKQDRREGPGCARHPHSGAVTKQLSGSVQSRTGRKNKIPLDVGKIPTSEYTESATASRSSPVPATAAAKRPCPVWQTKALEEIASEPSCSAVREEEPAEEPVARPPKDDWPKKRFEAAQGVLETAKARSLKAREAQLQKLKVREERIKALGGKPVPLSRAKTLKVMESGWREAMGKKFLNVDLATWGPKERGQVTQLIEKYDGKIVGNALQYLVEQWDEIRTRFLKGRGGVPSVGFLLRFHDALVVESQLWTEYGRVKKQVDEWYGGDPYKPDPPNGLYDRYRELRKNMADMGLPT